MQELIEGVRKERGPKPEPWVIPSLKGQGEEGESVKDGDAAARGAVRKTRRGFWAGNQGKKVCQEERVLNHDDKIRQLSPEN